jgi:hypothetical protein
LLSIAHKNDTQVELFGEPLPRNYFHHLTLDSDGDCLNVQQDAKELSDNNYVLVSADPNGLLYLEDVQMSPDTDLLRVNKASDDIAYQFPPFAFAEDMFNDDFSSLPLPRREGSFHKIAEDSISVLRQSWPEMIETNIEDLSVEAIHNSRESMNSQTPPSHQIDREPQKCH